MTTMTKTTMNTSKTSREDAVLERLESNSEAAWLAVAEIMPPVTSVIRSMLTGPELSGDVDDIAQETIISAVAAAHRWDPDRGPLVAWVTQIGKCRAIDHLRRVQRRRESAVVLTGQAGEDETMPVIDVAEDSFEDRLLERVDAWCVVESVLGQVKIVMRNDETMRRALMVLVECDGDVAEAAARLCVSPAVAREARRQVVRMAIVVHRAQQLHQQKVAEVSIEAADGCLPDVSGAWTRVVLDAVSKHGSLRTFTPKHLMASSGWCLATSRQRLEAVSWLLSVINTIALEGEIVAAPAMVPASMGVTA